MKYPDLDLGTIEAVVNKLGGMDGVRRFLAEYFRETGEFTVKIPALARPTIAELRTKYSWIDRIESDTSPTEAVTLKLGTVLHPDEERIKGSEYECRRAPLLGRMFGYQQFVWLVDHQDEHPAFRVLLGQIYIDGPGLVAVHADGSRDFPCLYRSGERWGLGWDWVEGDLDRLGRLAIAGK